MSARFPNQEDPKWTDLLQVSDTTKLRAEPQTRTQNLEWEKITVESFHQVERCNKFERSEQLSPLMATTRHGTQCDLGWPVPIVYNDEPSSPMLRQGRE